MLFKLSRGSCALAMAKTCPTAELEEAGRKSLTGFLVCSTDLSSSAYGNIGSRDNTWAICRMNYRTTWVGRDFKGHLVANP